jgi:hypothetical protein
MGHLPLKVRAMTQRLRLQMRLFKASSTDESTVKNVTFDVLLKWGRRKKGKSPLLLALVFPLFGGRMWSLFETCHLATTISGLV